VRRERAGTDGTVRLIINPRAGRGRGRRYARRIRRHLERSGCAVRASFSRAPGDIETQTREASLAGFRHVVVVGGDGTVHEAVNGLLACDGQAALGLIPLGSGNDFAKAVGLPRRWGAACDIVAECIASGRTRSVDAGRCNDFYFANGVGIGLDAVVTQTSEKMKWLPGAVAYPVALIAVLVRGIPAARARIECDGVCRETDISMAVACNGAWIGGLFFIAPRARNDDGLLQVVVADALNRRQVLRLAPSVLKGTHEGIPEATFTDCRSLRIRLEPACPVEADGEIRYRAASELDIRILPGRLRLLA
jgi:YegS/Rv2252/BmrU family lipid kinase